MANRPGLMMYGAVVMPPGHVDATGHHRDMWQRWINHSRVFLNGDEVKGVVAYDECAGMVLTGDIADPELQLGVVSVIPRYVRAPLP